MFSNSDFQRSKLLDYWVLRCTDGHITEEQMENEHYRLAEMTPEEISQEYNRIMGGSSYGRGESFDSDDDPDW
jgi:hypothetical protein